MRLIVFIHGWLLTKKYLEPLKTLMESDPDFSGSKFAIFSYDASKFSNMRLEEVAVKLSQYLDANFESSIYEELSIVGHSIGGLIARKAYLSSLEYDSKWNKALTKIVLVGTPNRGSTLSQNNIFERSWMQFMGMFNQMRLIRDAFRGSAFITNLRIDWVRIFRELEDKENKQVNAVKLPHIVLLLCGNDDKVKPEDSLDVTQFGNAEYITIENESHESVIKIKKRTEGKYKILKNALLSPMSKSSTSGYLKKTDQSINNVTFFIHGIRTKGEWTEKAAEVLKGDSNDIIVLWPKYGFFSITKFLWEPSRLARVHWFRDEYADAFVKHPLSEFNFVGHSFGTYILANTLTSFKSIKFNRVYFAGSVVQENFSWSKLFESKQIKVLRNDCAAVDIPVGFLCKALNVMGVKKLGDGGFSGFSDISKNIIQNKFLKVDTSFDGHSVALNEANFRSIKEFMLAGDPLKLIGLSEQNIVDSPPIMRHLNCFAGLYLIIALLLVMGVFWSLSIAFSYWRE